MSPARPTLISQVLIMLRNVFFLVLVAYPALAHANDWLTWQSTYTHDPNTHQRVHQYSKVGPVYVYGAPNYMKSGYRNIRSSIQVGGSADNLHVVEEWGNPVVPYEQWRFSTRPYGAYPYPNWGPPMAGAAPQNVGFGFGYGYGGPVPGYGVPGYGVPGYGPGNYGPGIGGPGHGGFGYPPGTGNSYPYYDPSGPRQWIDGHYPTYDQHDRSGYYRPYMPGAGYHNGDAGGPW